MRGIKAKLKDGSQVSILEVVNRNLSTRKWKLKIVNNKNEISIIDISEIQTLGGT
ncbi:MAG: hypothetical protein E7J02_08780 [Staphylococcus warneri]|nr:hypothetical protein [Streptococcus mitis]MDU4493193.1 hypothetical protein [Staphylococcus warneri]MDU4503085.1 hypothetical protein [Staphylococcus warneri]